MFQPAPLVFAASLVILSTQLSAQGLRLPSAPRPVVHNTALPASEFRVGDRYLTLSVSEASVSDDLNLDGDMSDSVAHAVDLHTGAVRNAALGGTPTAPVGSWSGLAVFELSEGPSDLNGDSDVIDTVFHCIDLRTGTATVVPLSMIGEPQPVGESFLFGVTEELFDLNADGDQDDRILQLHDPSVGTTTNLGIEGWRPFHTEPFTWAWFQRSEAAQQEDINLDGDLDDSFLGTFDALTQQVHLIDLAVSTFPFEAPTLDDSHLAFVVSEFDQGGADLNSDGDAQDKVLHLLERSSGTITNLELSVGSGDDRTRVLLDGDLLAFVVEEGSQSLDLNGDGDTLDWIAHIARASTGTVTNLGRAIGVPNPDLERNVLAATDEVLFFRSYEPNQGAADLNADSDAFDHVLHAYDLATDSLVNLGWATFLADITLENAAHGRFATHVNEFSQGGTDLNGDGDATDAVLHLIDVRAGTATCTGRTGQPYAVSRSATAISISESQSGGIDLNEDGDADDFVLHVEHWPTGQSHNTRLAQSIVRMRLSSRFLTFLVSESSSGEDWSGDGDKNDQVLHFLRLR